MKTKFTLLLLTLLLGACSTGVPILETLPTQTTNTPSFAFEIPSRTVTPARTSVPFSLSTYTPSPVFTPILMHLDQSIIDIPVATPTFDEQCGGAYPSEIHFISWAIDDAIKTIDPGAEGWAEAIIQNCTGNDGKPHGTAFGMWFYIDKPTSDLNDYEALGSWIVDVMNLLDTIPRDEFTINADPSVVNFRFYAGASSLLDIRVPIKKYLADATGKKAVDIFFLFYTDP